MTTEIENIELRMMTVALGSALCYGEILEAKRIQKLMMDWLAGDDQARRSLYHGFRNESPCSMGVVQ